jgi:protein TonB
LLTTDLNVILRPPVIYAVTLEGGMKLGGKQQTPKDQRKVPIAPPKNVQELEKQNKIDPKIDPEAEVSLNPAKPKVTPTPKPKATPIPKATPTKPKATPVPKATPKPTPKKPAPVDIDKELEKAVQRYSGESTDAGGKGFGAGRMGGRSMGGGELRPPEFFAYKRILEEHIRSGWNWPYADQNLATEIEFSLSPDGDISNLSIVVSSGSREFDDSVIRAVKKASPAPPPPVTVYDRYFREIRTKFSPQ